MDTVTSKTYNNYYLQIRKIEHLLKTIHNLYPNLSDDETKAVIKAYHDGIISREEYNSLKEMNYGK